MEGMERRIQGQPLLLTEGIDINVPLQGTANSDTENQDQIADRPGHEMPETVDDVGPNQPADRPLRKYVLYIGAFSVGVAAIGIGFVIYNNLQTVLQQNQAVLQQNQTVLQQNQTVLQKNQTVLQQNQTVLQQNQMVLQQNREHVRILNLEEKFQKLDHQTQKLPKKFIDFIPNFGIFRKKPLS